MIILGNKYKITKEEKNLLYAKVKDIYYVDVIHAIEDDIVNDLTAYIQNIILKTDRI